MPARVWSNTPGDRPLPLVGHLADLPACLLLRCHWTQADFKRSGPSIVPGTLSTASCSGLPVHRGRAHSVTMGTKSRETLYGASIRAAAERATEARKEADRLAVAAWNKYARLSGSGAALGDALNAGYRTSKSGALAATRTRPWRSISCGDRRQRRSMNSNATCAARTVRGSGGIVQAQPFGGAASDENICQ